MAKVFEREFAGSSGGGTTTAIDTSASGCKLIVVGIAYYSTGTPTLSDSAGNTYTALTLRAGANYRARLYYCINPTLSASHTWTVGGGTTYPVMEVVGFDDTVTYEAESGAADQVSTLQPGSLTPSVNGAVIVAIASGSWGSAASINSGFTLLGGVGTTGQQVAGGGAFLIQTTAAAINPSWTGVGVNADNANAMAVFLPSGGGGGGAATGVTLTATASLIAGSASATAAGTAAGRTFTATSSLIAGAASGVVNGTLNFQAAGMEFGARTGLGIGTFALDAGVSYRYTVHADGLTLGAALYTSSAANLDAGGKLANYVGSAVVPGITYRVVAIRQTDGEAAIFRMVAA